MTEVMTKKEDRSILSCTLAFGFMIGVNIIVTIPMVLHTIDIVRRYWGW